jgi:hypothetical protein
MCSVVADTQHGQASKAEINYYKQAAETEGQTLLEILRYKRLTKLLDSRM